MVKDILTLIPAAFYGWERIMVFNATFNNISVISWLYIL
jgi:hypothetical protein